MQFFFQSEVTFLGHKVTDHGILPDDSKFETIKNNPTPKIQMKSEAL